MNYYNILQIDENASPEEIKQAYHKMARLFHPDNFNGSREDADEQMRKINEAYRVLSDPAMKNEYDEELHRKDDAPGERETEGKYTAGGAPTVDRVSDSPGETLTEAGSSCLSKIIEWIIYLGILCFLFNHFHVLEKIQDFAGSKLGSAVLEKLDTNTDIGELSQEEIVERYFDCLRMGRTQKVNELFSKDADNMFHDGTVKEYNKTVRDIYYGVEKDAPLYPLFREVRNFSYKIISSGKEGDKMKVHVFVQNCDIALLTGLLMQAGEGEISSMSDAKLKKLVKNALEKYKEDCMIEVEATFVMVREDGWKIKRIKPLKEFSKVIIGQADDLILGLNGKGEGNTGQKKKKN